MGMCRVVGPRCSSRFAGAASIATVGYSDLIYEAIELKGYVNELAREDVLLEVQQRLSDGQVGGVRRLSDEACGSDGLMIVPFLFSLVLCMCRLFSRAGWRGARGGPVTLSVNGRAGRRVACVLDEAGLALEILDMEGDADGDGDGDSASSRGTVVR